MSDRTIVYVLGPSLSPDMNAVKKYAEKTGTDLIVVGDGKRDINIEEVTDSLKDISGAITLIVDTHGKIYSPDSKHCIQLKEDESQKISTQDFFKEIALATKGKAIDCIFMPCHGHDQNFYLRNEAVTGWEGAHSEVNYLPDGSSIAFLTKSHRNSYVEETDNVFRKLAEDNAPPPLTATDFFNYFLTDGLGVISGKDNNHPTLFTSNGDFRDPFIVLNKRLENQKGNRFTDNEIKTIEGLNRDDLMVALNKINIAEGLNDFFDFSQQKHEKSKSTWGDSLYIAQILSPEAQGKKSDFKFIKPLQDNNIDNITEIFSSTKPSATEFGKKISSEIIILALEKGDTDLFNKVTKNMGNIPKELHERIFVLAAATGNIEEIKKSSEALKIIDPHLVNRAAQSAITSSSNNEKKIIILKELEKFEKIDWQEDRLQKFENKQSLLHKAIESANIINNNDELAKYVLSQPSININKKRENGETLLMFAAKQEIGVKLFRNINGIEWNAKDREGNSALDHCLETFESFDAINSIIEDKQWKENAELLIKNGARLSDINIKKFESAENKVISNWYQNQVKLSDANKEYQSPKKPFISEFNQKNEINNKSKASDKSSVMP